MRVVHGRAPDRVMPRSGQRPERHRWIWRPRGRHTGLAHAAPGLVRTNADARQLAHPALAWAHGERRVTFQDFDVVEAFADAVAEVRRADIGAIADKRALVENNI